MKLASALLLLGLAIPIVAHAQPRLPSGWRIQPAASSSDAVTFEATGLAPGEFVAIRQSARVGVSGKSIASWLADAGANDVTPDGAWSTAIGVQQQSRTMATGTRQFRRSDATTGAAVYVAVAVDEQHARLIRLVISSVETGRGAAGVAAKNLMQELIQLEGADSRGNQRVAGSPLPTPSPVSDIRGIRAGGTLVSGRYTGDLVNNDGKIIVRYDVTLFDNGEYVIEHGENSTDSIGRLRYDPSTGRLDLAGKLTNNRYHLDLDFCVFGRTANGEQVIYAEYYYGVGTFRVTLHRMGDVARLTPSVVADARKRAKAEADRYRFVTAPGAGIPIADIETVFYAWSQVYEIGGLQMKEYVYLLLRDGTVHNGMPVPPQDMDIAASRRSEPTTWGRWRKQSATYAIAWADAPTKFSVPQGNPVLAGRADMTLQGEFEGASSYEIPGGAGVWSKYSVTFTSNGRFRNSRSGGGGMSVPGGVTTTTVYDDNGAVGSASSPVFAGGGQTRTPDTGDRRGTYRIDGYGIFLTYESGHVERKPFFVDGTNVTGVWMLNSLLMKKK